MAVPSLDEVRKKIEENMKRDRQAFSTDDLNPHKLTVINPQAILGRELNAIEERMFMTIQNVDQYSWNRGKNGGLRTGFDLFDEGMEGGLQPGLLLFAAQPNVGKSTLLMQIAKQTSELNENVYCAYFSLDDSENELLPRYIACDQRITIGQAKMPEKYMDQPEIMEKRNEGYKNLYRNIHRFGLFDAANGNSVEAIENTIKDLLLTLPEDTKLVVFVDNFYDLTVESKNFGNDKAKYEYTADEVKRWAVQYDIPVCCTAELRKLNGNKRPIVDDLRETTKIAYEANAVFLLYNEVGIREENASVYWLEEDSDLKKGVLEIKFGKNKFSSYKGTRFYEMVPEKAFVVEASQEAQRRYASLIYQG